jgi:hypothetical protein
MAALIPFSLLPFVYYLRICVSSSTSLSLYPKHQLANDVYAGRNLWAEVSLQAKVLQGTIYHLSDMGSVVLAIQK